MKPQWFQNLAKNRHLLPAATRQINGGAQMMAALEELAETERLAPAELASRQREMLLELARHAAAESPHFAERLKSAGLRPEDLAQPGGLARLAPLTRRELRAAGDSLACRTWPAPHGEAKVTTTSGSTGEPISLKRTFLCDLHWMAFTLREHLWHGRDFAGRLAVLRANIGGAVNGPNWGAPCHVLFRTGPSAALPPTRPVEEMGRWLAEFKPQYLLALPSLLGGILAWFGKSGQKPPPLLGVRTLSETVSPELRAETRRVFGVEIQDIYSSQEGGVMATQCPEAGTYHVSETILLEVVDAAGRACRPGEVGRILVTDLVNFATPLVRYEIGDYAEAGLPCPCGRGLPTIRRFVGRERNLVMLPDGSRHWPTVGFHRWKEAFEVRQFQFTQLDRHTIEARLSATGRPDAEQEGKLTEIIRAELGYPFEIRYAWQEEPLPRGPGGKFEEFVSRAA